MPPQPLTNYRSFLSMLVQVSCEIAALKFETKRIMIASDALTSDVPTFPYTAEEDQRFIDLLQVSKGTFCLIWPRVSSLNRIYFFTENASNPFVITFVARLWGIVGKHDVSMNPGRPYDPPRSSEPPPLHSFW
jgi:hypothetical protein